MENIVNNPEACDTCEMHKDHCLCGAVKDALLKIVLDTATKLPSNIIYVDFKAKKREKV